MRLSDSPWLGLGPRAASAPQTGRLSPTVVAQAAPAAAPQHLRRAATSTAVEHESSQGVVSKLPPGLTASAAVGAQGRASPGGCAPGAGALRFFRPLPFFRRGLRFGGIP